MAVYRALRNRRNNQFIARKALLATGFFARAKGLLGRNALQEGEALIIRPCNVIHMFFMRFPIDVVFCSKQNKVLRIEHELKPWRTSPRVHLAHYVIELPAGKAEATDIQVGDEIMEDCNVGID